MVGVGDHESLSLLAWELEDFAASWLARLGLISATHPQFQQLAYVSLWFFFFSFFEKYRSLANVILKFKYFLSFCSYLDVF